MCELDTWLGDGRVPLGHPAEPGDGLAPLLLAVRPAEVQDSPEVLVWGLVGRVDFDGLLVTGDRLVPLPQQPGEVVVSERVVRIEIDGLPVTGDCLVPLLCRGVRVGLRLEGNGGVLGAQGVAEVNVTVGVIRVDVESHAEVGDGLVQPLPRVQRGCELKPCSGVVRIDFDGLLEAGEGLVRLLLFLQREAEVDPGRGAAGTKRSRGNAVTDCCFQAGGANQATEVCQFEVNPEVVGVDLAGPLQEGEGLLGPVEPAGAGSPAESESAAGDGPRQEPRPASVASPRPRPRRTGARSRAGVRIDDGGQCPQPFRLIEGALAHLCEPSRPGQRPGGRPIPAGRSHAAASSAGNVSTSTPKSRNAAA